MKSVTFFIKANSFPLGVFTSAGSCTVAQMFNLSCSRLSHTLMLNHLRLLPELLEITRNAEKQTKSPAQLIKTKRKSSTKHNKNLLSNFLSTSVASMFFIILRMLH